MVESALDIDLRQVRRQGGEHGRFAPSCVVRVRLLAPVLEKHFQHEFDSRASFLHRRRPLRRRIVGSVPDKLRSSRRASASPAAANAVMQASSLLQAALQQQHPPLAASLAAMAAVAPAAQPSTILSRYLLLHVGVCDVDPTLIGGLGALSREFGRLLTEEAEYLVMGRNTAKSTTFQVSPRDGANCAVRYRSDCSSSAITDPRIGREQKPRQTLAERLIHKVCSDSV